MDLSAVARQSVSRRVEASASASASRRTEEEEDDDEDLDADEAKALVRAFVKHALDGVRGGERAQYYELLEALEGLEEPRVSQDKLLMLTVLVECVSSLDENAHEDLLRRVLSVSLWRCADDVAALVVEFCVNLVSTHTGSLLQTCLEMLVAGFVPPGVRPRAPRARRAVGPGRRVGAWRTKPRGPRERRGLGLDAAAEATRGGHSRRGARGRDHPHARAARRLGAPAHPAGAPAARVRAQKRADAVPARGVPAGRDRARRAAAGRASARRGVALAAGGRGDHVGAHPRPRGRGRGRLQRRGRGGRHGRRRRRRPRRRRRRRRRRHLRAGRHREDHRDRDDKAGGGVGARRARAADTSPGRGTARVPRRRPGSPGTASRARRSTKPPTRWTR